MSFNLKLSLEEAKQQIIHLENEIEEILEQGSKMATRFKNMFAGRKPALRCVRFTDRSYILYRWREYGSTARSLELLGEKGLKILAKQDTHIQRVWLGFESERQEINFKYSLAMHHLRKLENWVEQQMVLQEARLKLGFK